jgi:hypothetical protein
VSYDLHASFRSMEYQPPSYQKRPWYLKEDIFLTAGLAESTILTSLYPSNIEDYFFCGTKVESEDEEAPLRNSLSCRYRLVGSTWASANPVINELR